MIKNKKVVVTGGAGFIGSNLARHLCEDNEVVVIDNLSTGYRHNIAKLISQEKILFLEESITNTELLLEVFSDVDYVFHQAAVPSVPRSVADPLTSNEANVTGTLSVLWAAKECGVKKVVFASSSSVYGDTPSLPKHEQMSLSPLSPYAVGKLADELYADVFEKMYDFKSVGLRYFNVFGPFQDPNSEYAAVVPKFIALAKQGKSPVIYGDGGQTRDFTFVGDVIEANVLAAISDASGVFNVAGGKRVSVNELAESIIDLVGVSGVAPVYEPVRPGDILHSLADISKANEAFGFVPKFSLLDGLKVTVEWFVKQM